MTLSKVDTWIKAGYKLLGTEGIDGIKVERLAKILDLNKSGFYHYFETMDFYVKGLLHTEAMFQAKYDLYHFENQISPFLLLNRLS